MSSSFRENVRRIARDHGLKSAAIHQAQEELPELRKKFLIRFDDISRNILLPVLTEARQELMSVGGVFAEVRSGEERVALIIDSNRVGAIFSIHADALRMRVILRSATRLDLSILSDPIRYPETNPVTGVVSLEQISVEAQVETYVQGFLETVLV